MKAAARTLAVIVCLFGLALVVGGARLSLLGGSAYYLIAGIGYVAAAIGLWRLRRWSVWLFVALLVVTQLWALWESGFTFWPMLPRVIVPAACALFALLLAPRLQSASSRITPQAVGIFAAVLALALLVFFVALFFPHGEIQNSDAGFVATAGIRAPSDWTHYGRDASGTRFAPFGEITRENVSRLTPAWTFRSGDVTPGEDQNVPLQIGELLYSCSRNGHVTALDPDTGAVKWRFDPKAHSPVWQRCRGVGYHDAKAALPAGAPCVKRLLQTTIDARLLALDAETGVRCEGFGEHGAVDLKQGMGEVKPGFYFQTSAPLVARQLVIIGGFVADNQARGEPSGVVRAYDVLSGALVWAWDMGDGAITRDPPEGSTFTRGTPNMWSTASFDDELGLVYLPLGNETPDYFGQGRSEASEQYASSVVALDVTNGRLKWSVQTVHHDLWDYDVPSQPALVDVPDGKGGKLRALLQTTKRGQIFLLDRATGAPLASIVEKPVPQSGQVKEEWLAKTQPYSVGMPAIGAEPLSESQMWGITPLDHLWCRIRFRQLRYDGEFTPPGLQQSIQYPGNFGGFNWGSVSVDAQNGYAFMNDTRLPVLVQLLPPDEARKIIAATGAQPGAHGPSMQEGTPYGVAVGPMMSPLGVPCNQPPFGTLTAVDLKTRQIAWQVPLGTTEDTGPLGLVTHLPMPVGMPTIGGTLATATGLVFFAGSQDFYIRAFDAATGRLLWKHRMPVGSGSTPMTYVSPRTGRQYVLVSAGGTRQSPVRGDYVIAYALPTESE